jgi:hypothetical protein
VRRAKGAGLAQRGDAVEARGRHFGLSRSTRSIAARSQASQKISFSSYDGRDRIGRIVADGKHQFEAFDTHDRSLGYYASLKAAASAVARAFDKAEGAR